MGIPGKEYAHALGEQLDSCTDAPTRAALARMLAATGSPDAQPYLLDAMAAETDATVRAAIREALAALERSQHEAAG